MTIDFTDPNDLVETIHNDCKEDPSLSEAISDDDLFLEAGTENAVLDCKGSIQEAPLKMLFRLFAVLWTSHRPRRLRARMWKQGR